VRSPAKLVSRWLKEPQVTNRQALVVGVIGSLAGAALLYGGGRGLQALGLIDFRSTVPVWIAALVGGVTLGAGLWLGARKGSRSDLLRERISDLEGQAEELGSYAAYAEHLRDALADLRKLLAGEMPAFSARDFVEVGLFVPAQRFLTRSQARGEVRFSVLHQDGSDFVMAGELGLHPALGHSLEGRQQFRMPITESFSMHAFQRGKVFASGRLSDDGRFTPNPKAARPYESIVSIPLWKGGEVDGILNVIATEAEAFNAVDRSYLTLLGSVIDVARAAQPMTIGDEQPSSIGPEKGEQPRLPPGDTSD
jgi:hypothetical protein